MADDLIRMQRAAAHRVREMQEHSRRVFEAHQGHPPEGLCSPGLYRQEEVVCPPPASEPCAPPPPPSDAGCPRGGMDTEQWMLLGLALLLFRCGCRPELTLALLYLAL